MISIINYFIENNIKIHSVFDNSLYIECSEIHTYLMNKWKHKINFNVKEQIESFVIFMCRGGNYENMKYILR